MNLLSTFQIFILKEGFWRSSCTVHWQQFAFSAKSKKSRITCGRPDRRSSTVSSQRPVVCWLESKDLVFTLLFHVTSPFFWLFTFSIANRSVISAVFGRWLFASSSPAVHFLLCRATPSSRLQTLAGTAAPLATTSPRERIAPAAVARKSDVHTHRPLRIELRLHRTARNTLGQTS